MLKIVKNKVYLVRGDSGAITVTVLNADGNVLSIQDDDEILLTVRATPTSGILFQKTGSEIIITPEDTADLAFGTYCYDVQITLADGNRRYDHSEERFHRTGRGDVLMATLSGRLSSSALVTAVLSSRNLPRAGMSGSSGRIGCRPRTPIYEIPRRRTSGSARHPSRHRR